MAVLMAALMAVPSVDQKVFLLAVQMAVQMVDQMAGPMVYMKVD